MVRDSSSHASGRNREILPYLDAQSRLKHHEIELLERIEAEHPDFCGYLLDIGCASGTFLAALHRKFPTARLMGVDASSELIEIAKVSLPSADFSVCDARLLPEEQEYDIIVASGILSVFEDFESVLSHWMERLSPYGALYIFGRFNVADVDTIIRFRRVGSHDSAWQGGLTAYSLRTVVDFVQSRGWTVDTRRFHIPVDLPRTEDPLRTFTIVTRDGDRIVANGANIIAEHHYLRVCRVPPATT